MGEGSIDVKRRIAPVITGSGATGSQAVDAEDQPIILSILGIRDTGSAGVIADMNVGDPLFLEQNGGDTLVYFGTHRLGWLEDVPASIAITFTRGHIPQCWLYDKGGTVNEPYAHAAIRI